MDCWILTIFQRLHKWIRIKYGDYEYATIGSVEHSSTVAWFVLVWWLPQTTPGARIAVTGARGTHSVCTSFALLRSWISKAFFLAKKDDLIRFFCTFVICFIRVNFVINKLFPFSAYFLSNMILQCMTT